jgi:hypothetical protein
MTFDENYADCLHWCICGDPREVCEAYGGCEREDDLEYNCYDETWEEIYGEEVKP